MYSRFSPEICDVKPTFLPKTNLFFQWVTPKLVVHTTVFLLLLLYGQWILALVNVPLTAWLFYEYFSVPSGNMGVYDPTEIHNRGQLRRHTRDCMIYIGYYLIFFFIYLYW